MWELSEGPLGFRELQRASAISSSVLSQRLRDLSDGNKKFRETLAKLELDTPVGVIKLDSNRQAIASVFVTETVDDGKGNLVNKLVKTVANVSQTLGIDPAKFAAIGAPSRTVPECKKY